MQGGIFYFFFYNVGRGGFEGGARGIWGMLNERKKAMERGHASSMTGYGWLLQGFHGGGGDERRREVRGMGVGSGASEAGKRQTNKEGGQ